MNSGIKSTFFPWFNTILKGFRRGEFTVFTGPTGSGKTTLLSQMSLDFARSGLPTLWCSFELKNEVLMGTMLNQYAGMDLGKEPKKFDYYADQFDRVPVYLQTYFGSTHVEDVMTMIDYAVYTHDVGHIIIDNLQFMLSGQGRYRDRFEMQDEVIATIRRMATNHNVHITLVIHPRKGDDKDDLQVSSIFGTAKSTQEADNVIILQNRDKYRVIDVKKNRFDGEIGKCSLWFDRTSKRFEQISPKEIEELLTGSKINDVLERRSQEVKEDMETQRDRQEQAAPIQPNPASSTMDSSILELFRKKKAQATAAESVDPKAFERIRNLKASYHPRRAEQQLEFESPVEEIENSLAEHIQEQIAQQLLTSQQRNLSDLDQDRLSEMFDVKVEGGSTDEIPSIQLTNPTEEQPQTDTSNSGDDTQEPTDTPESKMSIKRKALSGMADQESIETIKTLYKEGEVLYTYNDLIGELSPDYKKKSYIRYSQGDPQKSDKK